MRGQNINKKNFKSPHLIFLALVLQKYFDCTFISETFSINKETSRDFKKINISLIMFLYKYSIS